MRIIALDFAEVNIGEGFWFLDEITGKENRFIKISPEVVALDTMRNAHLADDSTSMFWFEDNDYVTVERL